MKRYLRFISAIVFILLLIYLLIHIDFYDIYTIFKQTNPLFFIPAFLAYSFSFLLFNLRTTYSIGWIVKPGYWFSLKVTLAGFFINTITPGAQIGGEPVRAYFLGKKYKKSKAKLLGGILGDRLFHLAASLFFIISSILFILTFIPISRELRSIFITVLVFILSVIFFLFFLKFKKTKFNPMVILNKVGWLTPFKNNYGFKKDFSKHLGNFTKSFKRTVTDRRIVFLGIFLSLSYWILNYLVSYFLFLSFGVRVSFFLIIVVVSLGNLVGDFSPTPGGIGLIEGFMVFLYSVLGINFALALAVSILTRMILYFHTILIGGISLIHLDNSLKD